MITVAGHFRLCNNLKRPETLITATPINNGSQSAAQHLRHQERQLQRLLGVQPRVAGRLVAAGQVGVGDLLRAAQALGDVLAGQLDVDAARDGCPARGAPRRSPAPRRRSGRNAGSCNRSTTRGCCRAWGRTARSPGARTPRTFSMIGGSTSRTLPLPIREISVSRPGWFRGSSSSTYSTACSGVVPGPILRPIGLDSSWANAMCAPSSCRVRSPTHRK